MEKPKSNKRDRVEESRKQKFLLMANSIEIDQSVLEKFPDNDGFSELIDETIDELASQYENRLTGDEAIALMKMGCPPENVSAFAKHFSGEDILTMIESGISSVEANEYPALFCGEEIISLISAQCPPPAAKRYLESFLALHPYGHHEAVTSILAGKAGEERRNLAKRHFNHDVGYTIAAFYRLEINPKNTERYKNLYTFLSRDHKLSGNKINPDLRGGSQSIVVFSGGRAWKIPSGDDYESLGMEARLLRRLSNPEYVVSLKREIRKPRIYRPANPGPMDDAMESLMPEEFVRGQNDKVCVALELEYIKGKTLEEVLRQGRLNPKRAIRYSRHVFYGLEELKSAGIYHRDLRPSNIMIETKQDKAVIIDLGIATDDPNIGPEYNRRYGGTDLMSLGQLMYKMATGHNLFNESTVSSLSAADDIAEVRKRFCLDEIAREQYLKQVFENVKDSEVADGIKTCLMAGLRLGEKPLLLPIEMRDAAYLEVRRFFEWAVI